MLALSIVVHSPELHEELVGSFVVPLWLLSKVDVGVDSLPFGGADSKELLRWSFGATVRLALLQPPEQRCVLAFVKFRLKQAAQPCNQLGVLGAALCLLHWVAALHEVA